MRAYLYTLLIGSLISCSGSSRHFPRFEETPDEKALYAQVIHLDTALFRYPFRVTVKAGNAVVMDLHNADYFLHAFSYPEWKHITSFGKRGEGLDEMLPADCIRFISTDSIWTLDCNRMRINRWKIAPNIHKATIIENIELDKRLVRVLDFYPMKSGFLVGDYLGENRHKWTNSQGEWFHSTNQIPTENKYDDVSRPALAQAWRSFFDYNPSNNILAMVTQLGEVLEIYNLQDNNQIIKYGPEGEPKFQIAQSEGIPTGIMGFSDIQITDKHIYTVFHGRKFKDIAKSLQKGERPEDGDRFIHVFDLNGKFIYKYILDRAIYGIHVDESTGTIIATNVNSDEPLIKFKIEQPIS